MSPLQRWYRRVFGSRTIQLRLPADAHARVVQMAQELGLDEGRVVGRALSIMDRLRTREREGWEVILRHPQHGERVVVLAHGEGQ